MQDDFVYGQSICITATSTATVTQIIYNIPGRTALAYGHCASGTPQPAKEQQQQQTSLHVL